MGKVFYQLFIGYSLRKWNPLVVHCCDEEFPAAGLVFATFNDRTDSPRVHNLLVGFLQGENTESWIHNIAKY